MVSRGLVCRFVAGLLAAGLLGVLVSGCGPKQGQSGAGQPQAGAGSPVGQAGGAEKTLKIGVALSLTGNFSREGNLMKAGYEFWRDKVNAAGGIKVGGDTYKVELVMYDDKSDTNTSVKLTEKLITDDKVNFIFGPYSSGITQATSAIAEKYRMVNFAVNANAPAIYERGFKYVFGLLPLASHYLDSVLDFAVAQEPKPQTVAIIAPDNLFAAAAAEGARQKSQELGLQVVAFEKYPMGTKDLSSLLSQIKTKNPDILLNTGFFEDGALVVAQLKDLQWSPKLLAFTIAASLPDFRRNLGADAEGIMGGEWWTPNMKYEDPFFGTARQFGDEIKARYGYEPTYHVANAAVAGYVLQKAIEKAGSIESEKVRQALTELDINTMFGRVKFDSQGRNVGGKPIAFQIQNGELVEVWPQEFARGKGVYPRPRK